MFLQCGFSPSQRLGLKRMIEERKGGCENFLKQFAVSPCGAEWLTVCGKEKLLFCILFDEKGWQQGTYLEFMLTVDRMEHRATLLVSIY